MLVHLSVTPLFLFFFFWEGGRRVLRGKTLNCHIVPISTQNYPTNIAAFFRTVWRFARKTPNGKLRQSRDQQDTLIACDLQFDLSRDGPTCAVNHQVQSGLPHKQLESDRCGRKYLYKSEANSHRLNYNEIVYLGSPWFAS